MDVVLAAAVAAALDVLVEATKAWIKHKLGRKQLPEPIVK